MTELEACIALNMVPGVGPARLRVLLEKFQSAPAILAASRGAIEAAEGIGPAIADAIVNWRQHAALDDELRLAEEHGARIISWDSPEYPACLRSAPSPPVVLYIRGDIRPGDEHAIGVVGSRISTHYGNDSARRISCALALAGYTIVSGLARGIDTAAHEGALAAGGRTVAVVGSGLGRLYPPENKPLAERIAASGAVVSEYPMLRPADRQTFPYRNRIVAAWGRGLLVVEAALRSGALITASQAAECGRPVFAVPGPIDRPTSAGANRLIQQGARLVTCADDILDEFNELPLATARSAAVPQKSAPPATLTHDETLVATALEAGDLSLDELAAATRLPAYKISSTLTLLEMKRIVRALPGQRFARRGTE